MGDLLAFIFLLTASYQDIRKSEVSWFLVIPFFVISFFLNNQWHLLNIGIAFGLTYFVAEIFERNSMQFSGGDAWVIVVLSSLCGIIIAAVSLLLGLLLWRIIRSKDLQTFVPFIPYIFVAWLVVEKILNIFGLGVGIR